MGTQQFASAGRPGAERRGPPGRVVVQRLAGPLRQFLPEAGRRQLAPGLVGGRPVVQASVLGQQQAAGEGADGEEVLGDGREAADLLGLGRHVAGGEDGDGQGVVERGEEGQVDQLDPALGVHQDVGRGDVPVHPASAVQLVDDAAEPDQHLGGGREPAAVGRAQVCSGTPSTQGEIW